MTDPDEAGWEATTWEGNRRAQLRRSLSWSVRERLEALEALADTSRHLATLRDTGRLRPPAPTGSAEED